jgi:DNA replication protein DnaC
MDAPATGAVEQAEQLDDTLPQRLGAVLKASPYYQRIVDCGPPPPDPEPRCATCRDVGYLRHDVPPGDPLFGKLIVCECRRPSLVAARVARFWAKADAPPKYTTCTLESYPGDAAAVETLRAWAVDEAAPWLVLAGEYGAGKTGLSVALLRDFAERGQSVLFVNAPSMLRRVRATYSGDRESETAVIDSLAEVDVLAIDDVGKERLTDWAKELVYDVINRRYNANLRTVVTTNHDAPSLEVHVGPATFWRIFERAQWLTLSGNLRRTRRTRGA